MAKLKNRNDLDFTKQDEIALFKNFSENYEKRLEAGRVRQEKKRIILKLALSVSVLINIYLIW